MSTRQTERAAMSDNNERADRARQTLWYYADYSDGELCDSTVVDLLTDLMHLCREDGANFNELLQMARVHYEAET